MGACIIQAPFILPEFKLINKIRGTNMKSKKSEIYSIDFHAYTSNLKNWNVAFKAIISFSALLIYILANKNHIMVCSH